MCVAVVCVNQAVCVNWVHMCGRVVLFELGCVCFGTEIMGNGGGVNGKWYRAVRVVGMFWCRDCFKGKRR